MPLISRFPRIGCTKLRPIIRTYTSRPILYHYIPEPLPYHAGLELQEALVARRLLAKSAVLDSKADSKCEAVAKEDVILLLQHTPVYTTGRRDTDPEILSLESERLTALGADYIATQRGGQTTFHGPGQLVGYPILDTSDMNMSTRQYVEAISKFLEKLFIGKLAIPLVIPSPQVGAYPTNKTKIASIGIQIRHRITSHGFALNVNDEPLYWFEQIIACGSPEIKATSIVGELRRLGRHSNVSMSVPDIVPLAVDAFSDIFGRDLVPLDSINGSKLLDIIKSRSGSVDVR